MTMWIIAASWYALASVVTCCAYGLDKRAAVKGAWRTKEKTLHVLALLGGWPGALAGQALFRHKTRKVGFQVITWLIVAVHVAAWGGAAWLLWRNGA